MPSLDKSRFIYDLVEENLRLTEIQWHLYFEKGTCDFISVKSCHFQLRCNLPALFPHCFWPDQQVGHTCTLTVGQSAKTWQTLSWSSKVNQAQSASSLHIWRQAVSSSTTSEEIMSAYMQVPSTQHCRSETCTQWKLDKCNAWLVQHSD